MWRRSSNGIGPDDDEIRTGNAMVLDPYGEVIAETRAFEDDAADASHGSGAGDPARPLRRMMGGETPLHHAAVCALILSLHAGAAAAQGTLCSPPATGELRPSRDLYCIDLTATQRGGTASGVVALEYIPGPFTVPITVDGHYRYAPRITLRGLPRPPLGTRFVAWAATPTLDVIRLLGKVTNGDNDVREIALDRFLVLITAETAVTSEPHGPILLRGESPSNRMRPPDLYQLSLGAVMPPPPAESSGWHGVPMTPNIPMLPSEMALTPAAAPWLPRADSPVGEAQPSPERCVTATRSSS